MKTSTFLLITALFIIFLSGCDKEESPKPENTVTDIDGNMYHYVTIGTQVWMVENLKTTKYRNGDPIPMITSNQEWISLNNGAYCNYDNNEANAAIYGRLYNWYAISDNRHLAPEGWHIPTNEEWLTLVNYVGGEEVASGKLKETGRTHWESPNTGATDEFGFKALPGGYRDVELSIGEFKELEGGGYWYTANLNASNYPYMMNMGSYASKIFMGISLPNNGCSVRCVKD